jgi:hypothetical protein
LSSLFEERHRPSDNYNIVHEDINPAETGKDPINDFTDIAGL